MELTIEQQIRVFAQYIGQPVRIMYSGKQENIIGFWNNDEVMLSGGFTPLSDIRILLRPLSAITDEEIENVLHIMLGKKPSICEVINVPNEHGRYIVAKYKKETCITHQRCEVQMKIIIDCSDGRIRHDWAHCSSEGVGISDEPLYNHEQIEGYLHQIGIDRPVFIAPDHACNGMTAIELGLAIDSTNPNT